MQTTKEMIFPYKIDSYCTFDDLCSLEKEWGDLIEDIPELPIFQTWEWIKTWWQYFGQDRQLWLITARDKQGKLRGIAPFMKEEYKRGFLKLRMVTFIGTGSVCPTHLKILTRPSELERVHLAFINYLKNEIDEWDILRIQSVKPNSVVNGILMSAGGCTRVGSRIPSPYIILPDSLNDYLKSLKSRFRRDLNNRKRRFENDYPDNGKFSYVTEHQEIDKAMGKLENFIRDRCHAKGLSTDWDDTAFAHFQRAIAHQALDSGWLRLYTLIVGDRIIGVISNFRFKDSFYGYNMGFDIDWRKYSPGHMLILNSIEAAIQEAASCFDMGRGNSGYKSSWTDHVTMEDEFLFSSNWKGALWIGLGNIERNLKNHAKHIFTDSFKLMND